MRSFSSYGPVNRKVNFCVDRDQLLDSCFKNLVGLPDEDGGHYFTIWGPRQTGKTWLMREALREIEQRHGDRFLLAKMSMQGVIMEDRDPDELFLKNVPRLLQMAFRLAELPQIPDWRSFRDVFVREGGLFDRPVILLIDEFDSLPPHVIDRVVTVFRDLYLNRESCVLHGLALIGVRAVLGVQSRRGSPFNVQRSLHMPNFLEDEVIELFRQYQEESDQTVDPAVVAEVFRATRGQPGLVCWFGELLTDKYNADKGRPIDRPLWRTVHRKALFREWNNTVLNMVKKARSEYQPHVLDLFGRADIPFSLDADWCSYLYMNGIIDGETTLDDRGIEVETCRFSSPFIQERLYNALGDDLVGDRPPILAVEPLDDLADVFGGEELNLAALLERYKAYLQRLAAKGINPWREQPRHSDLRLTEAAAHFHLYMWVRAAANSYAVVSPEFPTGNGKVDLHIRCGEKVGIIEVKSFGNMRQVERARVQAAGYAASLGLDRVTLALFVPSTDEEVLQGLSGQSNTEGVEVLVVAIGWDTTPQP